MMKLPAVLGFTALTFISWGTYGVLLHHGQANMNAMLKPFVFVGVAYFFIAVLFPGIMLTKSTEKGNWSFMGTVLSFVAGAVGALGALGIIMALNFGGKPIYVMPFVFGLAPVVNTLVTATINRTFNQIKFPFILGLSLVILGAIGVLVSKGMTSNKVNKTEPSATASLFEPAVEAIDAATLSQTDIVAIHPVAYQAAEPASAPKSEATANVSQASTSNTSSSASEEKKASTLGIIFSMVMAAFCWGAYGPVLHIGQMRMGGSRLRPFCCVGLAYFFIAVALPLALIQMGYDKGSWDFTGAVWSTAAGALGALGALGIIYAFNYGGKPIFVMPLVFGFAPIINTVVSMSEAGTLGQISPLFVFSLATTIAGAVMVLVFQPSSKHGKPHGTPSEKSKATSPDKKSTEPTTTTIQTDNTVVSSGSTAVLPTSPVVSPNEPPVVRDSSSSSGPINPVNPASPSDPTR